MTVAVGFKLLAIFSTVLLGWLAGRAGWLGGRGEGRGPGVAARAMSDVAFTLFVPALLFRTMVRLDFASLPWRSLAAFFVPAIGLLLVLYLLRRGRMKARGAPAALPAVATFTAIYGNALQLGIPLSAALYGEAGLALHVALVSLHGLVLITLLTVLVELDLARADRASTLGATVRSTVRKAVLHPVTLPVLAGLAWNLTGWGLHPVLDDALAMLGSAVVPTCLVLIGLSLAEYGLKGRLRGALALVGLKLALLPAVVLAVAHLGFGLSGMPLGVVVMLAALPVGSNALIFAQRYRVHEAEATAGIVVTTLLFLLTASVWLGVLAWIG